MSEGSFCALCFSNDEIEQHHSVFKSQVRELAHCRLNYIYLCHSCHKELHRNKGGKLDTKVKMMFQNKLEKKFLKRYISFDEVKGVLDISKSATTKLVGGLIRYKEGYKRNDLINKCIGR